MFEKIECEWPLFFLFMIIEGMFKGNEEQVEQYKNKLKPLVKRDKWGGRSIHLCYMVEVYSSVGESFIFHTCVSLMIFFQIP